MSELMWAILSIAGFISTALVTILWIVKNLLRSKSGKEIDRAKSTHHPLVLTSSLDHHARFQRAFSFLPGVLETVKFQKRVGKKRSIFHTPQSAEISLKKEDVAPGKDPALTQEFANNLLKLNTRKVFLEDGVPITVAVEDKVITAGIQGLGAQAFYDKLEAIHNLKAKIETLKENADFKEIGDWLISFASKISLVDFDVIRNYFDIDWDQSASESKDDRIYTEGYRDGQKKEKGMEKWIIFGGIGMGMAGIIGGAVFGYLKI